MEDQEQFQAQFKEIMTALNDPEFISKASNEELMGYLFMMERVENKLQKLVEIDKNKKEESKK
jgi:23S rRNA maturation mini-RNase III